MSNSTQFQPLLFDRPETVIDLIIDHVERVIAGKREAIEQSIIALLCGGHLLLEDVPGVGKTMMVRALAKTINCTFRRIQFTADLLPSDVTGVSIYNQKTGDFEFREGPLMANIVLADELNRTSPRTQAAMLEAMEEKHITVDGVTRILPEPFIILATQNPFNYEGTFPLPEAQLDRFLLRVRMGYPDPASEAEMLSRNQKIDPIETLQPILSKEYIVHLQQQVRAVYVEDSLKQYMVSLVNATRHHNDIFLGASPRASIALMRASQATAFIRGRSFVIPDDIKHIILSVIAHRLILKPEARMAGKSGESILHNISNALSVPILTLSKVK